MPNKADPPLEKKKGEKGKKKKEKAKKVYPNNVIYRFKTLC